jgi:hypothetical protein
MKLVKFGQWEQSGQGFSDYTTGDLLSYPARDVITQNFIKSLIRTLEKLRIF